MPPWSWHLRMPWSESREAQRPAPTYEVRGTGGQFRMQIHRMTKSEDLPTDLQVLFGPISDERNSPEGELMGKIVHDT